MPTIEFVNHASVLIREGATGLLTDPWYEGPAFHKGWRLLTESAPEHIEAVLSRTTHIWISHEHPDHFSIAFFKRWGDVLKDRGIGLLFQKIADQRVADFLRQGGYELTEMTFGKAYPVGDLSLTCLKDEFYDSALSVKGGGQHILNLNDCNIGTRARATEIRDAVGPCDVLLTQFSYAAWKGGRDNRRWREEAAQEKLANVRVQTEVLTPRMVIPFASFVAFDHERNAYLNDAANRPEDVISEFAEAPFAVQVMKPGDVTDGTGDAAASLAALDWWAEVYARPRDRMTYETVDDETLRASFDGWVARVSAHNARWAMRAAQVASPIRIFQPVTVRTDDTGTTWRIDPARGTLDKTDAPADLVMHSESLNFLFSNSFGFDTLAVNGTFEEGREGGFSRAARSLAVENLNNLGIRFGPGILFEKQVIAAFFDRLGKVRRKMKQARAGG